LTQAWKRVPRKIQAVVKKRPDSAEPETQQRSWPQLRQGKRKSSSGAMGVRAAFGTRVLVHDINGLRGQLSAASRRPGANLDWKPGWDQRLRKTY